MAIILEGHCERQLSRYGLFRLKRPNTDNEQLIMRKHGDLSNGDRLSDYVPEVAGRLEVILITNTV